MFEESGFLPEFPDFCFTVQGGDDVDEFVEEQFALVLVPGLQHDGLFRIVLFAERRVVELQELVPEPRRGRRRCLLKSACYSRRLTSKLNHWRIQTVESISDTQLLSRNL